MQSLSILISLVEKVQTDLTLDWSPASWLSGVLGAFGQNVRGKDVFVCEFAR